MLLVDERIANRTSFKQKSRDLNELPRELHHMFVMTAY